MSDFTLGIDLGPSSAGWAMIAREGKTLENGRRILAGVRIFPEGVDRYQQKREKPRGQQRREARSARRVHQRRGQRKQKLVAILRNAGILPGDPGELSAVLATNPYPLRARGLDEPLTLQEFGRVMFHLNQRRGFKSNRKQGKTKEDGAVAKGTAALKEEMEKAGCRTLGEYLASLDREFRHTDAQSTRLRNRYTVRSMYEDEFEKLWTAQAPHHPEVLTDPLKAKVHDAIFYQRPLRFDPDVIGDCELEAGQKRCPRAHWKGQQFRMLQEINLLQLFDPTIPRERPLTNDERTALAEALATKRRMSFDEIRRLLGLLDSQTFNLEERSKRSYLTGNLVETALRKKPLAAWYESASPQQREEVYSALAEVEDEEDLAAMAADRWGMSEKQIEKLLAIQLPTGYFRVSLAAITKLMPFLEAGHIYSEAKEKAGYALTPTRDVKAHLPPVDEGIPNLTNPLVRRALSEARKVVNAIIREYGKPAEIVVELARDMKLGAAKRRQVFFENNERRKENEAIRDRLIREFNLPNPSRDDVIKFRLWVECNGLCPYTGRVIPAGKLFGPEVQVEHIIPYSRSLDDSYMNKTLCYEDENRHKHNRTPWEAYGDTPERLDAILQRVRPLPYAKRRRFPLKEVDLDKFIERQLNDTRYLSRAAVGYFRLLFEDDQRVRCVKGGTTAELRHQWGLNGILDAEGGNRKTRDDHRHHAVDAAVIAMTTRSALQRLSTVKYAAAPKELAPPWESFRDDLADAVRSVKVSHRPARRIAGPLHEETGLGWTGEAGTYVRRVAVGALTPAMVEKIRDPAIRDIVKQRCQERGIELRGSKAMGKAMTDPPLTMPSGVPIRRVRILTNESKAVPLRAIGGTIVRAALTGGNHHVAIYEEEGEGRSRWTGEVVTRFEASRRLREGIPVVRRDCGDSKRFRMSLCINDMVTITDPAAGTEDLYRVQKTSSDAGGNRPDIVFRLHCAAQLDDRSSEVRIRSWDKLREYKVRKVVVGPLGRIKPAND